MIQQLLSRQFLTFLVTGGLAASVNFGSRLLYNQWLDFSLSVLLAYVSGMIVAYVLAKLFVFGNSSQSLHRSVIFFILVNGLAVAQTWGVSMALVDYILPWIGITLFAPEIAHAVGIVVPVFSSYWGHKHFTFRSHISG